MSIAKVIASFKAYGSPCTIDMLTKCGVSRGAIKAMVADGTLTREVYDTRATAVGYYRLASDTKLKELANKAIKPT